MLERLKVHFRDTRSSKKANEIIEEKFEGLLHLCDRITAVDVEVSMPHKHKQKGNSIEARVNISVPPRRRLSAHASAESTLAAINEAFDAARREVNDYLEKQHGGRDRRSVRSD